MALYHLHYYFSNRVRNLWSSAEYGCIDCGPSYLRTRRDGNVYWGVHSTIDSCRREGASNIICRVWFGQGVRLCLPLPKTNCASIQKENEADYVTFKGLETVLGPIIGEAFTSSSAGWRWAFYINLLVTAVCAPVYLLISPSIQPRLGVSFSKRFVEIDTLGTVLVGIYGSGLMAISLGGVLCAWGGG